MVSSSNSSRRRSGRKRRKRMRMRRRRRRRRRLERLGSDLELGPSSLSVAESAQCWPLITTDKHWGGLARAY